MGLKSVSTYKYAYNRFNKSGCATIICNLITCILLLYSEHELFLLVVRGNDSAPINLWIDVDTIRHRGTGIMKISEGVILVKYFLINFVHI